MSGNEHDKLRKLFEERQDVTNDELKNLVIELSDKKPDQKILCKFYLIRSNGDNQIRENDLIDFMISKIIRYVLKREEYRPKDVTIDYVLDNTVNLFKKAKRRFVINPNTGEGGELILFILLESQGIVQLVHKMDLKTSGQVHFHGFDAIHVEINGDKIVFHYGESKMYKDFQKGLNDAINSIKKIDSKKFKFEVELASSHIDDAKFDPYVQHIKHLLSPYSNKDNVSTAHPVFLGYDWPVMNVEQKKITDLNNYLVEEYSKIQDDISEKIKQKVCNTQEINSRTFIFYMMPFTDVDAFRTKFIQELKND